MEGVSSAFRRYSAFVVLLGLAVSGGVWVCEAFFAPIPLPTFDCLKPLLKDCLKPLGLDCLKLPGLDCCLNPQVDDISRVPPCHPEFDLLSQQYVAEYDFTLAEYRHRKSGATAVLMLGSKLEGEMLFSACFQTPASNNQGAGHVLQHAIQGGSRFFNVKDPFSHLKKSHLYTHLSSITLPNHSCHTVSSTNEPSFVNLVMAKLDAVLHPRVLEDENIFRREGWRYEVSLPVGIDTSRIPVGIDMSHPEAKERATLSYGGEVLDEMKDQYAKPDKILFNSLLQGLFPHTAYAYDSDGHPAFIPSLTFEDVKNYHKLYYHPSNGRFYFWGHGKGLERLSFLDLFLKEFDTPQHRIVLPNYVQRNFLVERISGSYPTQDNTDVISMAWVVDTYSLAIERSIKLAPVDYVALQVLDILLMSQPNGVLYKAFAAYNLDKGFRGTIFFELAQVVILAELKGVPQNSDHTNAVEELIKRTLDGCARLGFSRMDIDSALNTFEFMAKEAIIDPEKAWKVTMALQTDFSAGRASSSMLSYREPLLKLKEMLENDPTVFQSMIQKHMIDNHHQATFHMSGRKEYVREMQDEEKNRLNAKKNSMSNEAFRLLYTEFQGYIQNQFREDDPQELAKLPKLSVHDLDKAVAEDHTLVDKSFGVIVLKHDMPTMGIVYVDFAFSLEHISMGEFPLLMLLKALITEAGTVKMSPTSFGNVVRLHTGGIDTKIDVQTKSLRNNLIPDPLEAIGYLTIGGKANKEQAKFLLQLLKDLLSTANLYSSELAIKTLNELIETASHSVISIGDTWGIRRIGAASTAAGYAIDQMTGFPYYTGLKTLLNLAKLDWLAFNTMLRRLRSKIIHRKGMIVNLTGNPESLKAVTDENAAMLKGLISAIRSHPPRPTAAEKVTWLKVLKSKPYVVPRMEGFVIPSTMKHVALGGRMHNPGEQFSGHQLVAGGILCATHGIHALEGVDRAEFSFDGNGHFTFSSSGNAGLLETLLIFKDAGGDFVKHATKMTDEQVTEGVIYVLRNLERPLTVRDKGHGAMWRIIKGESHADRQLLKNQVIATRREDIRDFGKALLKALERSTHISIAALTSRDELGHLENICPNVIIHDLMTS